MSTVHIRIVNVINSSHIFLVFFFNDTATTEIYTLSLHDALPISGHRQRPAALILIIHLLGPTQLRSYVVHFSPSVTTSSTRSEEHTSELQSRQYLVCRLLLEKKKKNIDS